MSNNQKLGYPELTDENFVYEALAGHGMFTHLLPPCFTAEGLLELNTDDPIFKEESSSRLPVEYFASRNRNVPRTLSIPHPFPHLVLCQFLKTHWSKINLHIGKPQINFSQIHVRKMYEENTKQEKEHIFEMNKNYAHEELDEVEVTLNNLIGCEYIISADIANFFPSIYSHSLTWAIKGTRSKCGADDWTDELDSHCRHLKGNRSTGILIGPHASNILSEIILTDIDCILQNKGFEKVLRNIDDYTFFATSEKNAREFIRELNIALREYELSLNAKKTKIIPVRAHFDNRWIDKLHQFQFPPPDKKGNIGFTPVNAFIEFALRLSHEEGDWAVLNYAIKVMSGKSLTNRAKRLYVKKILGLAIQYPYLLPIVEQQVFNPFFNLNSSAEKDAVRNAVNKLIKVGLENAATDALAFGFYYALKYNFKLDGTPENNTLELMDCISMTLAYEYMKANNKDLGNFKEKAQELSSNAAKHIREPYWLFIYQVLCDHPGLPVKDKFLTFLQKTEVNFFQIAKKATRQSATGLHTLKRPEVSK